MRGEDRKTGALFSYVDVEARISHLKRSSRRGLSIATFPNKGQQTPSFGRDYNPQRDVFFPFSARRIGSAAGSSSYSEPA